MTVKQISVFVENKPGKLMELAKLLEENSIDMRALSVAETEDFGILRIIVDDVYDTIRVLKDASYVCSVTDVVAVELPDQPGSLRRSSLRWRKAASMWNTPTLLRPVRGTPLI